MLLVSTGIFAGFIAGLFGIGGGVVVVPALYYIYTLAEVDESIRMHWLLELLLQILYQFQLYQP